MKNQTIGTKNLLFLDFIGRDIANRGVPISLMVNDQLGTFKLDFPSKHFGSVCGRIDRVLSCVDMSQQVLVSNWNKTKGYRIQ